MTFKRNNLSQDVIHALTLTLVLCLTLLSGCSDKEEILPPEPEEGTDIVSEYKAYVAIHSMPPWANKQMVTQ